MSALLLFLSLAPLQAEGALTVGARIREVTVYTTSASVTRTAEVPAGTARVLVPGLPLGLDRDALRVRCGVEVLGVDLRERTEAAVPDARLAELRAAVQALEDRLADVDDGQRVIEGRRAYVESLFRVEERAQAARATGAAPGSAAGREERAQWLASELSALAQEKRALAAQGDEARRALDDLRGQIGRAEQGAGARVLDLAVELAPGAASTLEVEYLVQGAGWTPAYDLRAPRDLSKVELVYRASVVQQTGEDWAGVDLLLSTAEPQRGARGPAPETVWLDVYNPRRRAAEEGRLGREVDLKSLGYTGADAPAAEAPELEARVEEQGLTVRYRLPRKETVESRAEPSLVLIGRADLTVSPEHVVVPALDTTVWLRAKAVNTSDWVLLPGRAAVYFGADYIGQADVPLVQRTGDLLLHLGPDPGLSCERVVLDDKTEEAGLFSSRKTLRQSLLFKLRNEGGFTADPRGTVTVTLLEAIPRSNDERVEVDIETAKPPLAEGERWKKLREERGAVAWLVTVQRGEERTVELETEISYPEELELSSW